MKKLSLLTLVCCLLMFITACGKAPEVATVDELAPDFTLVDRQGKNWTLSELKCHRL